MNFSTKWIRLLFGSLTFVALSSVAQATILSGGVSDGGGGTTNPHPADPEWVAVGVYQYSARVLIPYLNAEFANFQRSSASEQAASPFAKIFAAPDRFFEIIKKTPVELHFSSACLDKNGKPWDGSIYPFTPGAICISPFTIAPKLNEYNVYPETVALVLHELSHLVGTTEAEAQAIQESALGSLSNVDFLDVLVAQDVLSNRQTGDIAFIIANLKFMGSYGASSSYLQRAESDLLTLRDRLVISRFSSLLVSQSRLDQFAPQFVRLEVLSSWRCSQDAGESKAMRDSCEKDLDRDFGATSIGSASEILVRRDGSTLSWGPEYDAVTIKRPHNDADVTAELDQLRSLVETILDDINALKDIYTTTIRL